MSSILKDKEIVLCVSGGIAAYKSVELLRLLKTAGAAVRVIMTRNAEAFVGATTFAVLSGRPVCRSLFDETLGGDASIRHIDWAREADAVVIAPATANIIGKLAGGIADDALSTFMMAVTCPVLLCPAMNTHMYENRAVQRNLDVLETDGYRILEPDAGELACGTVGPGRLPPPESILEQMIRLLTPKDLAGQRVLVTAGPTHEPIDPVRYIANPSSGKMGFAIALAAVRRGGEVILVTGPSHQPDPAGATVIRVKTAVEMAEAVMGRADDTDIIIKTAAVSDFRPKAPEAHKIKKATAALTISLIPNPDILKNLGERNAGKIRVGFAAETRDLAEYATRKLNEKKLHLIVGNRVDQAGVGFGGDQNTVSLFYRGGRSEELPGMEKIDLADVILDRVVEMLGA
ncbi:MAG: bifunctional phosphopantothenoylcysteine decarboxylase/phosphopantothenate--cysteine ligase CoaBC [Pseudomonadota bacterium]